ncbi:preQ1-regulated inosine-uridine nucleoside hydrolase [Lachnospiraceae bacterium KM106-2]|nr:preQ1-regulated inosine-uridine nucleoside hydrolase [Lachnospiraceae bacterium KM106-2]
MNVKRKVIIDCDPGIDDSLALMLALSSEELEVIGITTVCGNVPASIGVENAIKVLKRMDRLDIPVYLGAEHPLVRDYISAQDTHGMDGLGETNFPHVDEGIRKTHAAEFIVNMLKQEEQLSIIALGPMTNLAKAMELDLEAFRKMEQMVSMGGNFRSHGNCSPVAEYNYWCDPHAAKYVYEQMAIIGKKIHMVGLDVTREIVLTPSLVSYAKRLDKERGSFVESIVQFYFDFHWEYEKIIGCVINDPLAVAYFMKPDLCHGFEAFTTVETEGVCIGQSVVDAMDFWKKDKNSVVLTRVDRFEFMVCFMHRIFGGNEEEIRMQLKQLM